MVDSDLRQLQKELKAYAKRNKDFKYTDSAVYTFLLTGVTVASINSYSAVAVNDSSLDNGIHKAEKEINYSITAMRSDFKKARRENEKLLKNSNMELIQLMEQGDHVVKSPWSSWQYGINTFNNNWTGKYKGRGDKLKEEKYKRSNSLDRYQYSSTSKNLYGNTTKLLMKREPNAAIPVSASLTPKDPLLKNANLALDVKLGALPAFEARNVSAPVTPNVAAPNPNININLDITSASRGSSERVRAFASNGNSVMEDVALDSGKITIRRNDDNYSYDVQNVKVNEINKVTQLGIVTGMQNFSYGTSYTKDNIIASPGNAFFQVNGDGESNGNFLHKNFGVTLNSSNIDYSVSNFTSSTTYAELVHQDVHGGIGMEDVKKALDDSKISFDKNVFTDIEKTNANSSKVDKDPYYNVFANTGDITIKGPKAIFTHSYKHSDHSGGGTSFEANGVVMNAGNVTLEKDENIKETQHAVFLVSPDSAVDHGNVNNQHFYNTGSVVTKTDSTAMFLFLPSKHRHISITNKGSLTTHGKNTAGIFVNNASGVDLHLNFSDAKSSGDQEKLTTHTYSSNNSDSNNNRNRYYNKLTSEFTDKIDARNSSHPLIIYGESSAGLYLPKKGSFVTGQFAVDVQTNGNANDNNGSAGIYSASDIDLQGHYIKLGGSNNVGVYPVGSDGKPTIVYLGTGSIEIKGENNTGIVVKDKQGRVYSESEMVLNDGSNNSAIYAQGHTDDNDVEVKSIETETDPQKDSIFIYTAEGAKVKTNDTTGGLKIKGKISSGNPVYDITTKTLTKNVGGVYAKTGSEVDIRQTSTNTFGHGTGEYNIDITGARAKDKAGKDTQVYAGFGLFSDGSTIKANYNKIKATDTGVAAASINNGSIVLDNGEVNYSGSGYALYTNNGGTISLQNGTLVLNGNAIGYVRDVNGSNSVNLTGTTIDVQSDNVIVADLKNSTGSPITLNVANMTSPNTLKEQLLGTPAPSFTPTSSNYKYKYAVVDGGIINITGDIDKSDSTVGSDSEVFTKRLLYQNSLINVAAPLKAELDTAQLNSIDKSLTVPVGIAISASENSKTNNMTGINNSSTVSVDRTDGTDKGGIGLYADFANVKGIVNTGTVNVEKGTVNGANSDAIGIYATNSTPVTNSGAVNVGGEKSIGILGLSYRIDPATGNPVDPSTEPYYLAGKNGIVNVKNAQGGVVTMDNDAAIGIYVKNNSIGLTDARTLADINAVNNGTIVMNGSNNAIGMGADNGTLLNDTDGIINVNGTKSAGMFATNKSKLTNAGTINVADTSQGNESIGIYTDDVNTPITTSGTINVGKSSYGIYGKNVNMTGGVINVGDNGVGIYSKGAYALSPSVNLTSGTINVGNNNAVGVYIEDGATSLTDVYGNVNMTVGANDSFGYLITAKNAPVNLVTAPLTTATVGENSVYIYSAAPFTQGGLIENHTDITTTANNGYAIYSAQNVDNYGTIDLTTNSGIGNVGIYSFDGATATNRQSGVINVGSTSLGADKYGIGMATGYYNKTSGNISRQGNIVNEGTINVTKDGSIGMYAVGSGSKAINAATGVINLSGNNTVGMYIDQNAQGINYGTIQTTPTANGKGIKGVVVVNGGTIKNYGTINIQGSNNMGVYSDNSSVVSTDAIDTDVSGTKGKNSSTRTVVHGTATDVKNEGSVSIKTPPASDPHRVTLTGINPNAIAVVTTDAAAPSAKQVQITDNTFRTLDLSTIGDSSLAEASSLGMYVDTSGINITNPIQGLENLKGLTDINLLIGTEAANYTGAKAIEIQENLIDPYNKALKQVVTTGTTLNVNSASLTWLAQPVKSKKTGLIDRLYLVKVPYTDFASSDDPDTYNFLDGLEQRYGVEADGREKLLFNKLNGIGKGEPHIFAQAVNEMKGYEYSNTQQRIYETGSLLDKEFNYLHNDWRNPSKQNNKIKVFGQRDEYNTDTAGVIDYTNNAYGVAYVHEDEAVRLGNSIGWYAGAINNHFKFKDLGGSREDQTMLKAGLFKSMSPDDNGSLKLTVAGDVFAARNEMKRKFWIVDDTFEAKSNYYSYGAALKADLGYDIRLTQRMHLRPYGALKLEYGRFDGIKENTGQVRLEVAGNDYYSIKPEIGAEFKYIQPIAQRAQLSVGLSAAYENELGKINKLNQARVRYTNANWYNLRNEKEDRHGNGKFDLNIGLDNTRLGLTVNAGYDTKGKNIRGGIGFRAIY